MKHTLKITLLLLLIFLGTQIIGLLIINEKIPHININPDNTTTVISPNIPTADEPEPTSMGWLPITIAIIISTLIILVLIKFRKVKIWKGWYFLSVFVCLALSLGVLGIKIFKTMGIDKIFYYAPVAIFPYISLGLVTGVIIALAVAIIKIFRPNIYVHNIAEMFMYGGIATILVPWINLIAASILLILISIYDIYAVWQSKHMVKMARFQTQSGLFAGLMIRYKDKRARTTHTNDTNSYSESKTAHEAASKKTSGETRNAVLGGGDIAFPLLFSAVIMRSLMLFYPVNQGFLYSLITPLCAGAALFLLLYYSKKDRFYPAMPFISIGCFIGLFITWLVAF